MRWRTPSGLRRMFPGYPHVREHFFRLRNGDYVGNVTFSRLPLRGDGHLPFRGTTNMVLYTDVEYAGKVLRLYNVHLESNNISLTSLIQDVRGGDWPRHTKKYADPRPAGAVRYGLC